MTVRIVRSLEFDVLVLDLSMPLRPGIDRSSTRTSKSVSRTTRMTSVPSAASPATAKSAASPTMRLSPSRTIAWSSAITILVNPILLVRRPECGLRR